MIQKHPDSDICTLKWEIFCLRCFFCFYIYSTYIWQSLPKKVRYCISEVTSHICTILSGFDHLYRWIKLTNMVLFGTVSFEIQYPTFFWLPKILYIPNMLNHWTIMYIQKIWFSDMWWKLNVFESKNILLIQIIHCLNSS